MTLPTSARSVRRTVAFVAAAAFMALMVLVETGWTHHLDVAVREYFRPHNEWGPGQVRLGPIIDALEPRRIFAFSAALVLGTSLVRRSSRPLRFWGCLATLAGGVALVTKFIAARPDPSGVVSTLGGSYPSGHVTFVLTCLGLTLLALTQQTRWWHWVAVGAVTFFMSWALLLDATHWLTDIVGGLLLSVSVLISASVTPLRRSARRAEQRTAALVAVHQPIEHD